MVEYAGITGHFGYDVASGHVKGMSLVHKFGGVDALDTTAGVDVYTPGELYPFPAAGLTLQLASIDDVADTAEITVQGLDSDFEPITGKVNLNGKTPVDVTDSDGGALLFYRVNRAWNSGSTDLGGVVYGADTATTWTSGAPTSSDILLQIDTDAQQTEMAIYTIPAGNTGYIPRLHATVSGRGSAALTGNFAIRVALQVRENGGVFRTKHAESVMASGSSQGGEGSEFPLGPLSAGSDIKLYVTDNSLANAGLDGGFTIILVDTDA